MSTDNLNSLSDAELSQAVAVECAGWASVWVATNGSGKLQGQIEGRRGWDSVPDFATSADAVLPILLAHCVTTNDTWRVLGGGSILVTIILSPSYHRGHLAPGTLCEWSARDTFARAACIVLLKAHRSEKGQP